MRTSIEPTYSTSIGEVTSTRPVVRTPKTRFPRKRLDCSAISPGSAPDPARVRKTPNPEKNVRSITRTPADGSTLLALQLSGYDVNEWRIMYPAHRRGLTKVQEAALRRLAQGDLQITLTGAASRTGTQVYNDLLSCRRAAAVKQALESMLLPEARRRGRRLLINASGNGFTNARCMGRDCELPYYRSVLIQLHAPGVRPAPVNPVPPAPIPPQQPDTQVWDKYKIRCCRYKTEWWGTAAIGLGLDAAEQQIPRLGKLLRRYPKLRAILQSNIKKLFGKLKSLLARTRRLGRIIERIEALLDKIPLEFIIDTGIFEIVEDRSERIPPRKVSLCYTGIGIRVALPQLKDLFNAAVLPFGLQPRVREYLWKKISDSLDKYIRFRPFESSEPGPFTPFVLNHPVSIGVFSGGSSIMKDAGSGKVHLFFGSGPWTSSLNRVRIRHTSPTISDRMIDVQVGAGRGFELMAINEGVLETRTPFSGTCSCSMRQPLPQAPRLGDRPSLRH